MSGVPYKRYSVYRRDNDMPVFIYGTAEECAKSLGVNKRTFFAYICRLKSGKPYPKNYVIYEEEVDDEECL